MRWALWMCMMLVGGLVFSAGCRGCETKLKQVEPAKLSLDAEHLEFPPTYVGMTARQTLRVSNSGEASSELEAATDSPFAMVPPTVVVGGGSSEEVTVEFSPLSPGGAAGTLSLGEFVVGLSGEGVSLPECSSSSACELSVFDVSASRCVVSARPDGAPCAALCLSTGQCQKGLCVGQERDCSDGNACTVDACGEGGCFHAPLTCPVPQGPCKVARCDAATGCGVEDVPDGTLCGPDVCTATVMDVCITGQCVARARPETGRCANRWVLAHVPARYGHALAYDAVRQRVVLFGGQGASNAYFSDTWEWDGTTWLQRTPAMSPPARGWHALAYDAARQRVVLFGGEDGSIGYLSDTWEWDGTTWLQRKPAQSPPARRNHALAYDAARQRVVLFGGYGGYRDGQLSDTWEWDGTTWLQRKPALSPPARSWHALAYDAARQRVVLFGGGQNAYFNGFLSDTWEWDGARWEEQPVATSPQARRGHALAFDAVRQRVVLFGGIANDEGRLSDTWEWDGTRWVDQTGVASPPASFGPALAYDAGRQRLVLFGGNGDTVNGHHLSETWERDGTRWAEQALASSPPAGFGHGLAYDSSRRRVVLLCACDSGAETWEWDGRKWLAQKPPASPPPPVGLRLLPLAFDAARQHVVFFDKLSDQCDAWQWDGTTWAQQTPTTSPLARWGNQAVAYDAARERVVLFGGQGENGLLSDTWEWDGSTWQNRLSPTSPPARRDHALAYDAARRRVVLFGGSGSDSDYLSDTWEWDGATWLERAPVVFPPGRHGHALAYDSARRRVVLFGGSGNCVMFSDTWEWDGTTWLERTPVTSPPPTYYAALAYDAARQRLVLFDGSDTWLFLP